MVNYAHIYQFAFAYTDQNRATLAKLKDWKAMEKHLDAQNLLNQFVAFAEKRGVKPHPSQIQQSRNIILVRLKAYISRNVLGDEGFYPILFKDDPAVKKAISEISKKK